jgi:hypothetical protein
VSARAPLFTTSPGRLGLLLVVVMVWCWPRLGLAGFTDTVPKDTFIIDTSYVYGWIQGAWDNDGHASALVDEMALYEPGGPLQGTLRPDPHVRQQVSITQVLYGITDFLTLGVAVPVVLRSEVDLRLGWEEGEYQSRLGRYYSADDFWTWADSMGQAKPGNFDGNHGVLSDIVIALRYRFSDHLPALKSRGFGLAAAVMGAIPTGQDPDPDEIVSVGTTLWDLMTQGDLSFHLSVDKRFDGALDGRVSLGLDLFYDLFFTREREAPTGGDDNPLLLNHAPFVGDTYEVTPGDWSGAKGMLSLVPWKGPARATWLSDGDEARAAAFPPLLTLDLGYRFLHMQQTDYRSHSPHWDWKNKEETRRPGYRNFLDATATFSFLRLGVPLNLYVSYANASWIPGKNAVAPDTLKVGLQLPLKFW